MSSQTLRRFYKQATVLEDAAGRGWRVALDGRLLKSPAKVEFLLPSRRLAEAIAAEWQAQGDAIIPAQMPLMQLASTAIDRVRAERSRIAADLTAYADTDLLYYRAAGPAALVARQAALWQPLLDWLLHRYDAALNVTDGLVAIAQPSLALTALGRAVAALDDFRLAALATLVHAAGSLVIGLAVLDGHLSPAGAVAAAALDEIYQAEVWGEDSEAAARRASLAADIAAARRFLDLLD